MAIFDQPIIPGSEIKDSKIKKTEKIKIEPLKRTVTIQTPSDAYALIVGLESAIKGYDETRANIVRPEGDEPFLRVGPSTRAYGSVKYQHIKDGNGVELSVDIRFDKDAKPDYAAGLIGLINSVLSK